MCTEFWLGWFDAWRDSEHHRTDPDEAAKELKELLENGSVNLYMFEGGTNFGFMNGSNYGTHLTPDVTSYDYDAVLTEDGQLTEKYHKLKRVISDYTGEEPKAELPAPRAQSLRENPGQREGGSVPCASRTGRAGGKRRAPLDGACRAGLRLHAVLDGTGYVH